MDAVEFLERNQHALTNGDLLPPTSLYWALAGGYKDASDVPVAHWPKALQSATADWFDQWPEPTGRLNIDPDTFFAGQKTIPSEPGSTYTAYRLFRPGWVVPDSSAPPDIETENLRGMVSLDLNRRPLIFVTDWADLAKPDCCIATCMEALGLGGQIKAHEKRVAVGLSIQGALHKSTWIDSDFWIYWMPNLQLNEPWGYARHLVTGAQGAKEWVCRPTDTTVVFAHVISAQRNLDCRLDTMSDAYWQACRDWVLAYRQRLLTAS